MRVKDIEKENKRLKRQLKELTEIIQVKLPKIEKELDEIKRDSGGNKKRSALLPINGSTTELVTDQELDKKLRELAPKLTDGLKDGDVEDRKSEKKAIIKLPVECD